MWSQHRYHGFFSEPMQHGTGSFLFERFGKQTTMDARYDDATSRGRKWCIAVRTRVQEDLSHKQAQDAYNFIALHIRTVTSRTYIADVVIRHASIKWQPFLHFLAFDQSLSLVHTSAINYKKKYVYYKEFSMQKWNFHSLSRIKPSEFRRSLSRNNWSG